MPPMRVPPIKGGGETPILRVLQEAICLPGRMQALWGYGAISDSAQAAQYVLDILGRTFPGTTHLVDLAADAD